MDVAVKILDDVGAHEPGLRERKKQRTREKIAATAAQLFDEVGYDRARTAEIAQRADVSEATLFRYFPTKADLAVEEVRRASSEILASLSSRPVCESPYEAVRAAATPEGAAAVLPDTPRRILLLLQNEELAARTFFVFLEAGEQVATDFARRLGRPSESPEPRVLASAVVGAVTSSIREWLEAQEPIDLLTTFRHHIEILRPILEGSSSAS